MTTAGTGVLLQRWNQEESLIREFVIIGNTSNN